MLKTTLPDLRALKAAVERARACATIVEARPPPGQQGLYHSCEKRIKRRAGEFRLQSVRQNEASASSRKAAMSDRKYRQRGYQDESSDRPKSWSEAPGARPAPEPGAPAGARRISQDGPRNINMPGYREVVRCAQCGYVVGAEIRTETRCLRCAVDLRACAQCVSFDPGSRFECMEPVHRARLAEERAKLLRALRPAHDRRARDHDTQGRQLAQGVRRSLQFLEAPASGFR